MYCTHLTYPNHAFMLWNRDVWWQIDGMEGMIPFSEVHMIQTYMKNDRRKILEKRRNHLTIHFPDRRSGFNRRSGADRRNAKPVERKGADERRKKYY
jgi:hypothetical protein